MHTYKIIYSDCFIYVKAENPEDAQKRAAEIIPQSEIWDTILIVNEIVHFLVMDEISVGYMREPSLNFIPLASKPSGPDPKDGEVPGIMHVLRQASFDDFDNFKLSVDGLFMIYSANESFSNSDNGFWTENGWGELEKALIFSCGERETLALPMSVGCDAHFVPAKAVIQS